jgi:hypothetical protein
MATLLGTNASDAKGMRTRRLAGLLLEVVSTGGTYVCGAVGVGMPKAKLCSVLAYITVARLLCGVCGGCILGII